MSGKQAKRARQAEGPYVKPEKEGTPPDRRAAAVQRRSRRAAKAREKVFSNVLNRAPQLDNLTIRATQAAARMKK